MRPTLLQVITLGYAAGLVKLILLADSGRLPAWAHRIYALPCGDDLAHLFLALVLATLLGFMLAGRRLRYGRFSWPLGPAISLLILAGEEFSQMLITTRVFSPQDLCATAAGSLLGAYLVDGLSRRRAVPAAPCRPTSPQTH